MTSFKRGITAATATKVDLLVVGIWEGNKLTLSAAAMDAALGGGLRRHLSKTRTLGRAARAFFKGRINDATVISTLGMLPATEVLAVGLGPRARVDHESVRRAAGAAARHSAGYRRVALAISEEVPGGAGAAVEGFALGAYLFDRHLSEPPRRTETVAILGSPTQSEIDRAVALAGATIWARDLINESPSSRGPQGVAEAVAELATSKGLKVEILDEAALTKKGFNGILTVGRGSASPGRFVVITQKGARGAGSVGLVGKGITFDSGGLSLKTADGMETMKIDCSGAAAVAAAISLAPEFAPDLRVVGALALAENMPGGRAVKPGDVIHHYGGRTSEVLNTDSEGRLVLADALAWMSEQSVDCIVDVATLTGAMAVALGPRAAGYFANDPDLGSEIKAAAARTGERLWEMPLIEEYRERLDSAIADIRNTAGTRYGGPIYGALFLKDFVGDARWAHIDIAGPAWSEKGEHYLPTGATGFGTRTLAQFISDRAREK